MESLGKAVERVKNSVQECSPPTTALVPRRSYTADNLPLAFSHYADVVVPTHLWSPARMIGEPRTIRRQMTDTERNALNQRVADLTPALLPFDRPAEDDRVAAAIDELLASYRAVWDTDGALLARISAIMGSLDDMPAWAIEQGCMQIRRYGYEVREKREGQPDRVTLEQGRVPNDAQIHTAVMKFVTQRAGALQSAKALLAAPIEEVPEAASAPVVAEMKAEFDRAMASGHTQAVDEETRRRNKILKDTRERDLEARRREYLAEGLDPPKPKGGLITSLPMMLKMGWTIEGPPSRRVLVQPRKESA